MRVLRLLLAAFWLAAAAPPPPPVLAPYIHGDRFDPGDYGWLRGWFDGATAAEVAQKDTIRAWMDRCYQEGLAQTRAELQTLGIADPRLERSDFREPLCSQVASAAGLPFLLSTRSFADFESAVAAARPVADSYLLATRIAEGVGGPRGPALADSLLARPLGEQMVRIAMSWGEGALKDAPPLAPGPRAIVMSRLAAAMSERDHANSAWLKTLVEKEGWPGISKVGRAASEQAWLLVQHADADPAFQLRALRLMEPLARRGEASKRNYAYLYDRVMLKLTGEQRYGTQATCRAGKRVPQPLEEESALARERAAMELEPLADYMASMQRSYGDCPPDPPAPAPAAR